MLIPSAARYLALVPERTLPWQPTNVLTCGYFPYGTGRVAIATTVADVVILLHFGKLVEPIWGAVEFLRYVVVVNTLCGVGTWISMYFLYVFTQNQFFLFTAFGGFHGAVAGLLVATKQLLPNDEPFEDVPGFAELGVRNKHLPFLYGVATLILCVVHGAQYHHIGLSLFVAFGTAGSWAYLRYYQQPNESLPPGDASDEFAFPTLFPPPLDKFVELIAQLVVTTARRRRAPSAPAEGTTVASGAAAPETEAQPPPQPADNPRVRMSGESEDAYRKRVDRLARAERLLERKLHPDPEASGGANV